MLARRCLLLVLLILSFIAPAAAQDPTFDPSAPPNPPAEPPPPLSGETRGEAAPDKKDVVLTYPLAAGWSAISFPLTRVDGTSGFTRMLYQFRSGLYYPIDPLGDVSHLDTRMGYLAYCDAPATIRVWGSLVRVPGRSLALHGGWNLLGCPLPQPLPLSRVSAVRGGAIHPFVRAAGPDGWISPNAFRGNQPFNLLTPSATVQPRSTTWVFAMQPVRLKVVGGTPAPLPAVASLTPTSLSPGQVVEIKGRQFGTRVGGVTINGAQIPGKNILLWSDKRIQVRVPTTATSGNVVVWAAGMASNATPLLLVAAAPGALLGIVHDEAGNPLQAATVQLDSGQQANSKSDGSFSIAGVSPGDHVLYATSLGYKEAIGKVSIPAGGSYSAKIGLSALDLTTSARPSGGAGQAAPRNAPPPPPQNPRGTFRIVADAYDDGYHRWWVYKIEAWVWGGYGSKHWNNYWYSDLGDSYYELDCDDAPVGQTIVCKITWRSKDGGDQKTNTWYKKMYTSDQTETFDSPY
ncbi:MAG: hypothetical protein FJX76_08940 [Armatimonadetes bacterium]|nr:hypothetical protein [Armatimonadota bacterium]